MNEMESQNPQNVQVVAAGISKFAIDLYKQYGKTSSRNIFISPLSISAVLSTTSLGARGKTLAEMKKALAFDGLEDVDLHQAFGEIVTYLKKDKTIEGWVVCSYQLSVANRLYAEKSFSFLEKFEKECKQYYDADLAKADFIGQPQQAVNEINQWVSESTKGKITDIITSDHVNNATRLILLNAIYFKSAWEIPFEPEDTENASFFISPNEAVQVEMMKKRFEGLRYCRLDNLQCQVVALYYKFGGLSFYILLPDKATTLDEVEKNVTSDHLKKINETLSYNYLVNLWLPKFKLEEQLELKEILEQLGMRDVFADGSADLSGMDETRQLYASKVVHKAFVDVNENGTEAGATTACLVQARCEFFTPFPPVDFRVDRPFLFYIRDEATKALLFMGRVKNPQN